MKQPNPAIQPNSGPTPPFMRYRPQPSHFDWPRLYAEALALAEEILPGLDLSRTTEEGRRRLRARKAAAWKTNAYNFYVNRKKVRRGDHSFRPIYFIWTMLNACNYTCAYCDDHMGRKYPDLPETGRLTSDEGRRLLEIMRTGTAAVYFCGGEPTMRKDLPQMVRKAAELNYFPNMINTNGSLFHKNLKKEEWRDFLTNMDIIIVSLDGLNPDRLNELYVVKDSENVARNLLLLRELQRHIPFKLAVNSVISPENIDEVSAIVDLAWDLGIWFVPVPVNIGHHVDGDVMNHPDYHALREKIVRRKVEGQKIIGQPTLLTKLMWGEPFECYPTVKPHIDFNGEMLWPCKASQNLEVEKVRVLDYPNVDALYRSAGKKIQPDRFFGEAANQCGGACNWIQNYTTDAYVNGIQHPIQSGFVKEIMEFTSRL